MDPTSDIQVGIFKAPLSREEMHKHVVTVSVVLVRQLHFIFCRVGTDAPLRAQAMLLGMDNTDSINDPDELPGAAHGRLNFDHVKDTGFAKEMEDLYNFAYHGILYGTGYDFNSESGPSWFSRILWDLHQSKFVEEWESYSPCKDAIRALLDVCECAEARMILEGIQEDDTFMGWQSYEGHDGLTIRQMAHLSGMSEASLRTLANPKRTNPLKTHSNGRNTFISRDDAKAWLISKGRYVPLSDMDLRGAEFDLATEHLASLDELRDRLDARLHYLLGTDEGASVKSKLDAIRPHLCRMRQMDETPYLDLSEEDVDDAGLMKRIATALQLPPELLALKAKHLMALDQARELGRAFELATRTAQAK